MPTVNNNRPVARTTTSGKGATVRPSTTSTTTTTASGKGATVRPSTTPTTPTTTPTRRPSSSGKGASVRPFTVPVTVTVPSPMVALNPVAMTQAWSQMFAMSLAMNPFVASSQAVASAMLSFSPLGYGGFRGPLGY